MTTFSWTPEQTAVFDAFTETRDNLIIEALAGAAKTSTLVELCNRTTSPSLAIAFNKRIAVELAERMPSHVTCKTLNAVGHGSLRAFCKKVKRVEASKRRQILYGVIDSFKDSTVREELNDVKFDLADAISYGVQCGYVPSNTHPHAKRILNDDDFHELLHQREWSPNDFEFSIIRDVSKRAFDVIFSEGYVDFDDQIIIPTLWPASFPHYPTILVDEAQDLSLLQHIMLRKMVGPRGRLIAVGDAYQAIYGFRGAHEDSMNKLRKEFSMTSLPLSVTFRCPKTVAEHVRWRAPTIQSPEWAQEGTIESFEEWDASSIPDGAAIICRNNAPLFRAAMRLLRSGRRPELIGNDLVGGLARTLESLHKDPTTPREKLLPLLAHWKETNLKKYKNSPRIHDKAEVLKMFIEDSEDLAGAVALVNAIARMKGSIHLLTGHKSKGLEWDEVFFLDEFLIDPKRDDQADNLRYVIATRAKRRLVYVTSKGWTGPDLADATDAA